MREKVKWFFNERYQQYSISKIPYEITNEIFNYYNDLSENKKKEFADNLFVLIKNEHDLNKLNILFTLSANICIPQASEYFISVYNNLSEEQNKIIGKPVLIYAIANTKTENARLFIEKIIEEYLKNKINKRDNDFLMVSIRALSSYNIFNEYFAASYLFSALKNNQKINHENVELLSLFLIRAKSLKSISKFYIESSDNFKRYFIELINQAVTQLPKEKKDKILECFNI